jgi:hypothetical protein
MPGIEIDKTLQRTTVGEFAFPLGVYPVETMEPMPGLYTQFEHADGADSFLSGSTPDAFEDWEEWPDRMMFDAMVSSERIPALMRMLMTLLPARVFPILDVLGVDAFREIDPYIAYDPVGLDKMIEGVRMFGPWLFEDGLVGFGAMSVDPFVYVFLDEHKIATVRVQLDMQERVEKIMEAFGLQSVPEIRGADAVAHEHRSALYAPPEREDLVTAEEIVEQLRRQWLLQLNIPTDSNVDDDGNELGITAWRCVVRCLDDPEGLDTYAEVFLAADSLDTAESLATEAIAAEPPNEEGWIEIDPTNLDRVLPEEFAKMLGITASAVDLSTNRVHEIKWHRPAGQSSGAGNASDA